MNVAINSEDIREELEEEREELLERMSKEVQDGDGSDLDLNPNRSDLARAYIQQQNQSAMFNRMKSKLEKVESALTKLDEGDYGQCTSCGEAIDPERLHAIPYATMCASCKEEQEHRR
jgi:RNA polymerase-binding protein DksA